MSRAVIRASDPDQRIRAHSDEGFTLMELLISAALMVVVIIVVGGVLVSSMRAETTVRTTTTSTTDGQLAVNVITAGVRSSTAISTSTVGESSFAVVRTVHLGTVRCQAWFHDASTDTLYERTGTSAITAPAEGSLSSEWRVLAEGVVPQLDGAGVPSPVLASSGSRGLTLRFGVGEGTAADAVFVTTTTGRAPLMNASPACFA